MHYVDLLHKQHTRKIIVICASIVLFILCVVYIANTFHWFRIWHVIKTSNVVMATVGSVISIIFYWMLRALRWQYLLKSIGITVKFRQIYLYTASALSIGRLTPANAGEAIKVELLKRQDNVGRVLGYSTLIYERLADFIWLFTVAMITISYQVYKIDFSRSLIVAAIIGFILMLIFIVAMKKHWLRFIQAKSATKIPKYFFSIKTISVVAVYTILGWFAIVVGWMSCFQSINVHLGVFMVLSIVAVVTIISVLSMIPGSLGIAEISLSFILIHLGIATTLSQASALMVRYYCILTVLIGLLHFLCWKAFNRKKIQQGVLANESV